MSDRGWIVEPGQGEISLYMAVGDDVELTEEQQDALAELLRALEDNDAEVTGHQAAAGCDEVILICEKLKCGRVVCGGLGCLPVTSKIGTSAQAWTISGTFGVS
jgi:hypothetical protein